MKIAICDDEQYWREKLKSFCIQFLTDINKENDVYVYASGEEYLKKTTESDLVLLDIEMNGLDGIRIKECMEKKGCNTGIIFITSHAELMPEAFGCNVYGFLVKPVKYNEFYQKMASVSRKYEENNQCIDIREPGCNIRILLKNLLYIEACGKNTVIHMADNTKHIHTRKSMNVWLTELEGKGFAMPHRSLLVNLTHVLDIHKAVALDNGQLLTLSRGRRQMFKEQFEKYIIYHAK